MYKVVRNVLHISDDIMNSIIKDIASIVGNGININGDIILKSLVDKSLRSIVFYRSNNSNESPHKSYNKNQLYDARNGTIHIHFNRDIAKIISNPKVLKVLRYILSDAKEIKYLHSLPSLIVHPPGFISHYYMKIKALKGSILGIMCISDSITVRMLSKTHIKPDIIKGDIKYYKDSSIENDEYNDITLNKGDIFTWNPSVCIKFIKLSSINTSISVWLSVYNPSIYIPNTEYRVDLEKCKYFSANKLVNIDEFNYRVEHSLEYPINNTLKNII